MDDSDPSARPPAVLEPPPPVLDWEPDEAPGAPPVDAGRRPLYAAVQAAGLGLVAGGLEAVVLAATDAAPLSAVDRLVLGGVAIGADAALAFVLGGIVALVVPGRTAPARVASALAVVAGLLAGLYLWSGAATLFGEGRALGAAVFAGLPLLAAAVVFFNARFWLVRAERGDARVPWLAVAAGLALVGLGASLGVPALRDTRASLATGPSVVLITIEGLRADAQLPAVDALAAEGIRFESAVTPATDARPATAALLTGVHPLRLGLLDDGGRLARGWRTVAEVLSEAGLATAAFVPWDSVGAGSGLAQGFAVFDDRYRPAWSRPRLASFAWSGSGRTPAASEVAAFEGWLAEHADRPFFAWIDLAEQDADEPIARVVEALAAKGLLDRTTVVVTSPHGMLGGGHGGTDNRTLYDEVVHVPLVVRPPERPLVPVVTAQVRLMDVAPTLLLSAGVPPLDESEGVGLLDYGSGLRKATMWTTIVGRDLHGEPLLGLRNNGVKYVVHPDGREELYDANTDPGELHELGAEQPATLEAARELLLPDHKAFQRLGGR